MDLPADLSAHHISMLARNAYNAMLTEDAGVDRAEYVLAVLALITQSASRLADTLEQTTVSLGASLLASSQGFPSTKAQSNGEYTGNVVPFTR